MGDALSLQESALLRLACQPLAACHKPHVAPFQHGFLALPHSRGEVVVGAMTGQVFTMATLCLVALAAQRHMADGAGRP